MFGFIVGLHDQYGLTTNSGDELDDGLAIDLAASVMIAPGLEAVLDLQTTMVQVVMMFSKLTVGLESW